MHMGRLPCRTSDARKLLAVPFRAAHKPSERSEYAQPDTGLTLTTLAYYYDGLTPKQLLQALGQLLSPKVGKNEQREEYSEWLALAVGEIPAGKFSQPDLASWTAWQQ